MPVGIVALSFAKRAVEPNPVNKTLAAITDSVVDEAQQRGEQTLVVVQWEIAKALDLPPNLTVTQADATNRDRNGKPYLDSADVLNKAFELFRAHGVQDVVVVANPFLHKPAVEGMIRKAGFNVLKHRMPAVGFDNHPENLQWWCKGPIRFVSYLALQVAGKAVGKDFHGIGEKSSAH